MVLLPSGIFLILAEGRWYSVACKVAVAMVSHWLSVTGSVIYPLVSSYSLADADDQPASRIMTSGSAGNFYLGSIAQGVWGRNSPSGVQGQSLDRGSGGQYWSSLQALFIDFDCRNDQNLKIPHNSPPDSWPVCFTMAAKWYRWELSFASLALPLIMAHRTYHLSH